MKSKKQIVNDMMDKRGFSEKQKKFFRKMGYHITMFIWMIAKFMVFIWLMNKVYDRIGFEKIVILLFCIGIMSLRAVLKAQKEKEKWE